MRANTTCKYCHKDAWACFTSVHCISPHCRNYDVAVMPTGFGVLVDLANGPDHTAVQIHELQAVRDKFAKSNYQSEGFPIGMFVTHTNAKLATTNGRPRTVFKIISPLVDKNWPGKIQDVDDNGQGDAMGMGQITSVMSKSFREATRHEIVAAGWPLEGLPTISSPRKFAIGDKVKHSFSGDNIAEIAKLYQWAEEARAEIQWIPKGEVDVEIAGVNLSSLEHCDAD